MSDNAKHESRKLVGHTSVFLGWAQEFLSYGYNDVCQNGATESECEHKLLALAVWDCPNPLEMTRKVAVPQWAS